MATQKFNFYTNLEKIRNLLKDYDANSLYAELNELRKNDSEKLRILSKNDSRLP